ncbi:hypothetical protein Tco_1424359 [Tanacetum coccineum]
MAASDKGNFVPDGCIYDAGCIGEELRGCDDPMLKLTDIPGMLHLERRLLESRGCLLLVCRYDIGSREFTIYEMMKGCSVWTVRYLLGKLTLMVRNPCVWHVPMNKMAGTPLGEMADQTIMGTVHNSDHAAFASGYSCGGSLKASDNSALVSPTPIINMSRGQFNVDVAATLEFR